MASDAAAQQPQISPSGRCAAGAAPGRPRGTRGTRGVRILQATGGLLLAAWGPANGSAADVDGNGIVDGSDLGQLLSGWAP